MLNCIRAPLNLFYYGVGRTGYEFIGRYGILLRGSGLEEEVLKNLFLLKDVLFNYIITEIHAERPFT